MSSQIGIVITGCKRDFGVIADNNVVNLADSVLSKTLTDVRKHVLLHKAFVDFFSVEFVKNYIVFAGHRSSRDMGRDGYIAISLYVDNAQHILHVRSLLKELLDCYFKNYMNPLTWEPIANKSVDINWFQMIVDKYETVPSSLTADIIPGNKYQIYDNDAALDSYLESSLLSDHFLWQKVYLLSKSVYEDKDIIELHISSNSEKDEKSPHAPLRDEKGKNSKDIDKPKKDEMPPLVNVNTSKDRGQEIQQETKSTKKKKIGIVTFVIIVMLLGLAYHFYSKPIGETAIVKPMGEHEVEMQKNSVVGTTKEVQITYTFSSDVEGTYTGVVDEEGLPHDREGYFECKAKKYEYKGNFNHGVATGDAWSRLDDQTFKGVYKNNEYDNGTLILGDGSYFTGTFNSQQPYNGTWYTKEGIVDGKVVNGKDIN